MLHMVKKRGDNRRTSGLLLTEEAFNNAKARIKKYKMLKDAGRKALNFEHMAGQLSFNNPQESGEFAVTQWAQFSLDETTSEIKILHIKANPAASVTIPPWNERFAASQIPKHTKTV